MPTPTELLKRTRRIAAARGGKLLSRSYVNNSTPVRCRCARGHVWQALPAVLFRGAWCPACAAKGRAQRRTDQVTARLRALARRRRYELLPPFFVRAKKPILLRCPRGHKWQTGYSHFEEGGRCSHCREEDLLSEMHAAADRHEGKLLDVRVPNCKKPLRWRCAQGHRFTSSASLVRMGRWCRFCRTLNSGDLARMQRLARNRGGGCLSRRYTGARAKLTWRCGAGHRWKSDPASIVKGSWCPTCRRYGYSRQKLRLEDLQQTARERGGECLARAYVNNKVAVRWRCASGHAWSALPSRVRQGAWCPRCAHKLRGTIEAMRAFAIERGGRCVSRTWDDHRLPLRFECANRHRFTLHPSAVRTGVWCGKCVKR